MQSHYTHTLNYNLGLNFVELCVILLLQLNLSKNNYRHATSELTIWPPRTVTSSGTNFQTFIEEEDQCCCGERYVLQCLLRMDARGGSENEPL